MILRIKVALEQIVKNIFVLPPAIRDIACEAGAGVKILSYTLNNPQRLRQGMRDYLLTVIRDRGFYHHFTAKLRGTNNFAMQHRSVKELLVGTMLPTQNVH